MYSISNINKVTAKDLYPNQGKMKNDFRSKVLRLANDPNPESILNIIILVRTNNQARKDLATSVAIDAVKSCCSFQSFDKVQSLLVFATVIEAESAIKDSTDAHPAESQGDILFHLCHALCHLLVATTSNNPKSTHDCPISSTQDLVQKAIHLLQRGLVDSKFKFATVLWRSFLHVAAKSDKIGDNDDNETESEKELHKPALIYAQSIYNMVPASKHCIDDKVFFENEMNKLLVHFSPSDLRKWLKDEASDGDDNDGDRKGRKERSNSSESSSFMTAPQEKIDSSTYVTPNEEAQSDADTVSTVGMKEAEDYKKKTLKTNILRSQSNLSIAEIVGKDLQQESKPLSQATPNQIVTSDKMSPSSHTSNYKGSKRSEASRTSKSAYASDSITKCDIVAPIKGQTTEDHDSLEKRIENKQKGIIKFPSFQSVSSKELSTETEERAKLERRISIKTAGHYEEEMILMGEVSAAESTSSRSLSMYPPIKEKSKRVGYKTSESVKDCLIEERIQMKQRGEESLLESNQSNSLKGSKRSRRSTTSPSIASGSIEQCEEASELERRIANKTASYREEGCGIGATDESIEATSLPRSELKDLPRRSESPENHILPSEHSDTMVTEGLITVDENAPSINGSDASTGSGRGSHHSTVLEQDSNSYQYSERHSLLDSRSLESIGEHSDTDFEASSSLVDEADSILYDSNRSSFQPPGEETGVAIATAVESRALMDIDDAIVYDPKSKRRQVNRKMQVWTIFAIIAATAVAVIMSIVLTRKDDPRETNIPTSPPTTTYYRTLEEHVRFEFGGNKPYKDIGSPYGKAFYWLTNGDIYILNSTNLLDEYKASIQNSTLNDHYDRYLNDISMRYLFALLYYEMTGDQWVNCSAPISPQTNMNCSYLDRDSQLIHTKQRWLSPGHVCSWAGLTCDKEEKLISHVELNNLGLTGTIPTEISKLESLEYLVMFENKIEGQIPSEIGKLEKLLSLDLYSNRLNGEIPNELYDLANLSSLHLGNNNLNGTLPDNIGNMTSLKVMYLFQNEIKGSIPIGIGKLNSTLEYLSLKENQLVSSLPLEIQTLTKLKELTIAKNKLTGQLQLPIATKLVTLQVQNNDFTGSLPDNLYELEKLTYLVGDSNNFNGTIKSDIGSLSQLSLISLRENKLSGTIPEELSELASLETLRLHRNDLRGKVPDSICSKLTQLKSFYTDCENNLFEGDLNFGDGTAEVECICCTDCCSPGPRGECRKNRFGVIETPQPTKVTISAAQETPIPSNSPTVTTILLPLQEFIKAEYGNLADFEDTESAHFKALAWLAQDYLHTIDIPIPTTRTTTNTQILSSEETDYTHDMSIRYFCALLYYEMSGDQWTNCSASEDLSMIIDEALTCSYFDRDSQLIDGKQRWLSPSNVCSWAGLTCDEEEKSIIYIELNKLGLKGRIPTEISKLEKLQYLIMFENFIEGQIPSEIGTLKELSVLDLYSNQLTSTIPEEMYDLQNLVSLHLGNNLFNGTLSSHIGNMDSLKIISLKNNIFSGLLPNTIEDMSSLKELSLENNIFTGQLYLPTSDHLVTIQVQNNAFTGSLPDNLYELEKLTYLVGDNNSFSGSIKPKIGSLSNLSLVSFRENEFSGTIPEEFNKLTALETLHLQHNNFHGQVSVSICQNLTQLTNFYTDCLDPTIVQCECCSYCCISDIEGECVATQQSRLFYTSKNIHAKSSSKVYPTPSAFPETMIFYENSNHINNPYTISSRHHKSKKNKKSKKGKKKGKKGKHKYGKWKSKKSKKKKGKHKYDYSPTVSPSPSTYMYYGRKGKSKKGKKSKSKYKGKKTYAPQPAPINPPSKTNPAAPTPTPPTPTPPTPTPPTSTALPTPTCTDLDCQDRPTNPTDNQPSPKTGGANVSQPSPKTGGANSSPKSCTDLEDCERPTNPTTKIIPTVNPSPPTGGAASGPTPQVGGASQATGETPSSSTSLEPYSDCDDLDYCNRPTNPTLTTYRAKKGRKSGRARSSGSSHTVKFWNYCWIALICLFFT